MDENGKQNKFHELIKDKTVVLNMFYSNCKIKCLPLGKLLKRVNILLNKFILKDNIHFISITLDAKNDTIDDLVNFKKKVWDNNCLNWHFYTGNFDDIEYLRKKLGMYSPEPEIDSIKSNHSGNFMIFNEKTGFIKHTQSFDNPVDVARKVIQILPKNFYSHSYNLNNVNFEALTNDEIFENIQTMNSVFTVPFLPLYLRNIFDTYAEKQRGFRYDPIIKEKIRGSCCCKK
jgi:cytochrome oxidase Cu insertion factor (SCO1/SenC/PrrC family)